MYRGEPQTFEEFIFDCARNFGALITLRDTPNAEIPEEFEPSSHYAEWLAEAKAELQRWRTLSDEEVEAEMYREYEEAKQRKADAEVKAAKRRERYETMLSEVEAWQPPTVNHINLKSFMVDQIQKSIEHDCSTSWLRLPSLQPTPVFRQKKIEDAERRVERYTGERDDEIRRAADRTAWVKALRESLKTRESV